MKPYLLLIAFCVFGLSCSNDDDVNIPNPETPTSFTDPRDGQVYDIVKIGNQTWFAQNLNYDSQNQQSACYEDEYTNCFIYGRLYTGNEAQTVCPEGWHLPSVDEWQILVDYIGGINVAHILLAPGATLQGEPVNFNLLPASRSLAGNDSYLGTRGYYWTSTDPGLPDSFNHVRYELNNEISLNGGGSQTILESCRCIKD